MHDPEPAEISLSNNSQLRTQHTQTFFAKVNNAAVFHKIMKKQLDIADCKRERKDNGN